MELRPYQQQAKDAIFSEWENGIKKTLLVLPTGCGKTIVFAKVAEECVKGGSRVLILAHRGELLDQAADKIGKSTGLGCATEKAEQTCLGSWFRIVVGSVQSMMREKRLNQFPNDYFNTIIIDEAHHCISDSYQKVLRHFPDAEVLGVTATPDRGDMQNLGTVFESLAYEYTLPKAIKEGYLSPIKAVTIPLKIDNEAYEEWINSYQEHGLNFETWKQLHEEETYESEMGRRLVNRITGISKQKKIFNEGLKTTSNEDVKTLLKQSLGRTEIARSSGRKSYYSAKEKKVYLSKDAKSDTIAHELFHEIDDTYALVENGMLKNSVQQDYRRLQNQAKRYGKSIEEMLYLEYPEAFEVSKYGIKFKEEYRGISDILNGMSNGDILMGYSHKTDYWKKPGRLEKESWAQYGRMFYTDGKALEMAKKIFPEMSQEIEQRIRRLMK